MSDVRQADVVVLGAGLAGLVAARDLAAGGSSVLVLEANGYAGGRLQQATLADGRTVQLGGEVFSRSHTSYIQLLKDLDLTIAPGFRATQGLHTWDLKEGVVISDEYEWLTQSELDNLADIRSKKAVLAGSVDRSIPLSHPDAANLDRISIGTWARAAGALPTTLRVLELDAIGINQGSIERISMLAHLRMMPTMADPFEFAVAEGNATVAERLADRLGECILLDTPVRAIDLDRGAVSVRSTTGLQVSARAAICTIPSGPLRSVAIEGLTAARLDSLRLQRYASAAKMIIGFDVPFWEEQGASGLASSEGTFGMIFPQGGAVISAMVTPESMAHHLAAPPELRRRELRAQIARMWGDAGVAVTGEARKDWGAETFTMGGLATYAPGDLTALGSLHGTHEPPFFVAGSDHWECAYLEGAVRTGQQAAEAALRHIN